MNPTVTVPLFPVYLYLGLILLTGYAVVGSIVDGRRHWAEQIGLAFAGGWAVISFVLFWMSLLGHVPSRSTLIVIAAAALIVNICNLVRRGKLLAPAPPTTVVWDRFTPLGIIGLVTVILAVATVDARTHWTGFRDYDAFGIWLFKAKVVLIEPLRPLPAALTSPNFSYSHQDYPLAFPFGVAGLYAASNFMGPAMADALLLPLYLAIVAVAYGGLRRIHRRATAITLTAILIAAPTLTLNATAAVAETLLILNLLCALVLAVRWIEVGNRRNLIGAGLFAAAAAFTKNEGLALLPVVAIGLGVVAVVVKKEEKLATDGTQIDADKGKHHRKSALKSVAIGAPSVANHFSSIKRVTDWFFFIALACGLVLPWLIFRAHLPKTHEDYGSKLTSPAFYLAHRNRIGPTITAMIGWALTAPVVGLIWYIGVGSAVIGWRSLSNPAVRFLLFVLLFQLGFYLATFVVTPWNPNELIPMITPKLLTQATPAVVLLIGLNLREIGWGIKSGALQK